MDLTKVQDAVTAQEFIQDKAKELAIQDKRTVVEMAIGKVVRQGDIYIHCVGGGHKRGQELKTRQLALGESMGSRHIAEAPARVYEGLNAPDWARTELLGPCVVSDLPFTITHPEHAHIALPAGVYQVTHQMDARTRKRGID